MNLFIKIFAFLFPILLLFNCDKRVEPIMLSKKIKVFSCFSSGTRQGKLNFYINAYLLDSVKIIECTKQNDSLIGLNEIKLDSEKIASINAIIKRINFNSLVNNKTHKQSIERGELYCGPSFAFIDSLNNTEVYIPVENLKHDNSLKLFNTLSNLKKSKSNDSFLIYKYIKKIKSKYYQVMPPLLPLDSISIVNYNLKK